MSFKGLDGTFGKVAPMNVGRHKLIGGFPVLGDGSNVLLAGFVV